MQECREIIIQDMTRSCYSSQPDFSRLGSNPSGDLPKKAGIKKRVDLGIVCLRASRKLKALCLSTHSPRLKTPLGPGLPSLTDAVDVSRIQFDEISPLFSNLRLSKSHRCSVNPALPSLPPPKEGSGHVTPLQILAGYRLNFDHMNSGKQ